MLSVAAKESRWLTFFDGLSRAARCGSHLPQLNGFMSTRIPPLSRLKFIDAPSRFRLPAATTGSPFWRRLFDEADYLRTTPQPDAEESELLDQAEHDPAARPAASRVIEKYKLLIRQAREDSIARQSN